MSDDFDNDLSWLSEDDESGSGDDDSYSDLSDLEWLDETDDGPASSAGSSGGLGFTGELSWRQEDIDPDADDEPLADLSQLRGQAAPEPEPKSSDDVDDTDEVLPDWMETIGDDEEFFRPTAKVDYQGEVSDDLRAMFGGDSDDASGESTDDDDDDLDLDDAVPDWILQGELADDTMLADDTVDEDLAPSAPEESSSDVPDWMQDNDGLVEDDGSDKPDWLSVASDAIADDADDTPDWVQQDDDEPIADDEAVLDWAGDDDTSPSDSSEDETALPDWMSELESPADDQLESEMDWLPDSPAFDSLEDTGRVTDDESVPDWLSSPGADGIMEQFPSGNDEPAADLDFDSNADDDAVESDDVPDWMREELSEEEPEPELSFDVADDADDDAVESDDVPDWMREELSEEEPEPELSFDVADDNADDDAPDWIAAGAAAYGLEPAADFDAELDDDIPEVPDWIASGEAPAEPEEEVPLDFSDAFSSEAFDFEEEEEEFDLLSEIGVGSDGLEDLLGDAGDDFDLLGQLTGGGTDELIGGDDDPLAALLTDDSAGDLPEDDFFSELAAGVGDSLADPSDSDVESDTDSAILPEDDFAALFDDDDALDTPDLPDEDLLLSSMADNDEFEPDEDFSALFDDEPAALADEDAASIVAPPSAEAIEEAFAEFETGPDDDELEALFAVDEEATAAEPTSSIFDEEDDGELNQFFTDYDDHDDQYEDWFGDIPQPEQETDAVSDADVDEVDWVNDIEGVDPDEYVELEPEAAMELDDEDEGLDWLDDMPVGELPKAPILDDSDDDLGLDDEDVLGWLDEETADDEVALDGVTLADDDLLAGITSAADSGQHKLDRLLDSLAQDGSLELPITGQLPTIDALDSGFEFDSLMEDPDITAVIDERIATGTMPVSLAEDAPDWLVELSQSASGESSAAALARRRKERPLSDLNEHAKDLRERSLNLSAAEDQGLAGTALENILTGVSRTLTSQVILPSTATSVVTALPLTDEQEARAKILSRVASSVGLQGEDAPVVRRQWQRFFKSQSIIAILMVVVMLLPFVIDTLEVGDLPPSSFAAESRQAAFVQQIQRLESSNLALVAIDYGPTGAAELDDATETLFLHMIQRGAIPVVVGSNPIGMLRTQSLLEDISLANGGLLVRNRDYVIGRFIVGDAIGLRDFNENVESLVASDLEGVDTNVELTSLDDFSVIVVITENAERVRLWGEQVRPNTTTPMLAITGQAAAPLSLPYVDANPDRIAGMLVGFVDGFTYRTFIMDMLAGQIDIDAIETVETTEPTEAVETVDMTETPLPMTATATTAVQVDATFAVPDDISLVTVAGADTVSVYREPDMVSEVVGSLQPGESALVLGTNADMSWYSVLLVDSAVEGWAMVSQVSVAPETIELPTELSTATEMPSATHTPEPTVTEAPTNTPEPPTPTGEVVASNTPQPTVTVTLTPTSSPTLVPTAVAVDIVIVTSGGNVNVRSGPGTGFGPVAIARPNDQALLLGANEDESWYNILLEDGTEGWIAASLVRVEQYIEPSESDSSESSDLIEVGIVISNDAVNVRSGAGTGFTPMAVINPGDQVTIIGRTEDESWYNIRLADGVEGWVAAFLLRIEFVAPNEGVNSGFKMDHITVQKPSAALKQWIDLNQDDDPTPTPEGSVTEAEGGEVIEVTSTPTTALATPTVTPTVASIAVINGERVVVAPADDQDDYRDERWSSMNIGIIVAVLIITLGNTFSIIRSLLKRRRERR